MSYLFRTYAQAAQDVRQWERRLPADILAVCGVPRSGCIPAVMLAQRRNLHHVTLEDLQAGRRPWEMPLRRAPAQRGPGCVLVVDDTCWSGQTINSIRPSIHPRLAPLCRFAALYAGDGGIPHVDFYGRRLPTAYHSFEWNVLHDRLARHTLCDFDGVLCEDWTGGEEELCPDLYARHLAEARPLWTPTYPLRGIVTARLETHRLQTVAWLKAHGVQYGALHMGPYANSAERRQRRGFGDRKAAVYAADDEARLFVENDHWQAQTIQRLSRKAVLSIERMELLGGVEPDPFPRA